MKMILLVLITFSLSYAEFTRSNEIVTDSLTGLAWQDDISGGTWESSINYCEDSTLDGKSDWRLPNIIELISIYDDRIDEKKINSIFINISVSYWSSTTDTTDTTKAWTVGFDSISVLGSADKGSDHSIRCVRAGQ